MKKSQLISILANKYPYLNNNQITETVELILSTITNSLKEDNRVEIRGFGALSLRSRNVQTSFPNNNIPIEFKMRNSIYFRIGKEFFDRLNDENI